MTPFEAHFGRKFITPSSKIIKKSISKNLTYSNLIKYYLDKDAIPGRMYLTSKQWANTGICSDVDIEIIICAATARSHNEQ